MNCCTYMKTGKYMTWYTQATGHNYVDNASKGESEGSCENKMELLEILGV